MKRSCGATSRTGTYRVAEAPSPPRDTAPADYRASVDELNQAKQAVFEKLIAEVKDGETGAFLVWGDPMLYDSTIRNLDALKEGGLAFDYEVIPGITAIQALAAAHKIPLNRIAEAVTITTGRKLANGFPPGVDSVVVLLDGEDTFRRFADQDMDIYWGAYLGTPDEILIAGKVKDVAEEIHRRRSEARRANGWIMDTYLLRGESDYAIFSMIAFMSPAENNRSVWVRMLPSAPTLRASEVTASSSDASRMVTTSYWPCAQ